MSGDLRNIKQQLLGFAAPAVPFVVQTGVSATVFTVSLYAAQAAGYFCRVSCATPVVSSICGMAGVAVASAAAGQASVQCNRYYRGLPTKLAFKGGNQQHILMDAIIGMTLWKVLGGRFRSVMPSDLFAPGAMAVMSLPSPGARYAGDASRDKLRQMYKRYGCHHCGSKRGPVIGDHIPPNRQVWGSSTDMMPLKLRKVAESLGYSVKKGAGRQKTARSKASQSSIRKIARKAMQILPSEKQPPLQRYYPQCSKCSHKQSGAVKANKRRLIMHYSIPTRLSLAGAMVGLRYYDGGFPPAAEDAQDHGPGRGSPGGNSTVDSFGLRLYHLPGAVGDQIGDLMTGAGTWLSLRHRAQSQGILQMLSIS